MKSKYIKKNYHTSNSFPGFVCILLGPHINSPWRLAARKNTGWHVLGHSRKALLYAGSSARRAIALPQLTCSSDAFHKLQHIFKFILQDTLFIFSHFSLYTCITCPGAPNEDLITGSRCHLNQIREMITERNTAGHIHSGIKKQWDPHLKT